MISLSIFLQIYSLLISLQCSNGAFSFLEFKQLICQTLSQYQLIGSKDSETNLNSKDESLITFCLNCLSHSCYILEISPNYLQMNPSLISNKSLFLQNLFRYLSSLSTNNDSPPSIQSNTNSSKASMTSSSASSSSKTSEYHDQQAIEVLKQELLTVLASSSPMVNNNTINPSVRYNSAPPNHMSFQPSYYPHMMTIKQSNYDLLPASNSMISYDNHLNNSPTSNSPYNHNHTTTNNITKQFDLRASDVSMDLFLAQIRKPGMDLIFPQSLHDLALAVTFACIKPTKCESIKALVDQVLYIKETNIIPELQGVSKTKVRGLIALLRQCDVVLIHHIDKDNILLVVNDDVHEFQEIRTRHDHFIESFMIKNKLYLSPDARKLVFWHLTDEEMKGKVQEMNSIISKVQNYLVDHPCNTNEDNDLLSNSSVSLDKSEQTLHNTITSTNRSLNNSNSFNRNKNTFNSIKQKPQPSGPPQLQSPSVIQSSNTFRSPAYNIASNQPQLYAYSPQPSGPILMPNNSYLTAHPMYSRPQPTMTLNSQPSIIRPAYITAPGPVAQSPGIYLASNTRDSYVPQPVPLPVAGLYSQSDMNATSSGYSVGNRLYSPTSFPSNPTSMNSMNIAAHQQQNQQHTYNSTHNHSISRNQFH